VVAENDSGYLIGYRSTFDKKDNIKFHYFQRHDSLLNEIDDHEEVNKLIRFSKGFYTLEKWHDTLVFNDLRFGQIAGWYNPEGKFAFHYFLQHKENDLVLQRGRFAGWNLHIIGSLIKRIVSN